MRSKLIFNGRYEIFENATLYKINEDGKRESVDIYRYPKNKGYASVIIDGKKYYMNRLLADAFIPNPNNGTIVRYKDKNPMNLDLDNLVWVTPQTYGKRVRKKDPPCKICGKPSRSDNGLCNQCNTHKKLLDKKIKKRSSILEGLDVNLISDKQKNILELYLKGIGLREIGEAFGISKQAVDNQINCIKRKKETE